MSTFTTPLIVSPLENGRDWKLVEPFKYVVGDIDALFEIRVPAGFVTDFASIPRLFWFILPPTGPYGKASVIHDLCYRGHLFNRAISDAIFLEAMGVLKVSWWKKWVVYLGVRIGGRGAWKENATKVDETRQLMRQASGSAAM